MTVLALASSLASKSISGFLNCRLLKAYTSKHESTWIEYFQCLSLRLLLLFITDNVIVLKSFADLRAIDCQWLGSHC